MKDTIEQLDQMRSGVDYKMPVRIRNYSIMLRPLSIMEEVEVIAEVTDRYASLPENYKNRVSENLLQAKESLKLASTSDVGTKDPKITDYILDRMTNTEIQYLWKQYIAACDRVNPSFDKMSEDELKELLDKVKKNPELLTEFSFWELVNFCQSLIKEESPTDK